MLGTHGLSGESFDYDILVVGSGPAGQRAAIQGAKPPGSASGRRALSQGGTGYLCRRRHDRVPCARLKLDGTGPARHMPPFRGKAQSVTERFLYGIYAVPEISMVGKNEEELTEAAIPYEIGKARHKEIARGQILGDVTGLLKLIFHSETRQLPGVHIIGEGASELIQIGQAVLSFCGTIDYLIETVFNYPTLAECYKVAAFDGINRLGVFEPDPAEIPQTG